jgi:hypothetical protein
MFYARKRDEELTRVRAEAQKKLDQGQGKFMVPMSLLPTKLNLAYVREMKQMATDAMEEMGLSVSDIKDGDSQYQVTLLVERFR